MLWENFDAVSGEELCGGICENTIQHNGIINSSFYSAEHIIESGGVLSPNSQVTYKAGDRIRLNSGFSSRQADKFSAKIGECDN